MKNNERFLNTFNQLELKRSAVCELFNIDRSYFNKIEHGKLELRKNTLEDFKNRSIEKLKRRIELIKQM